MATYEDFSYCSLLLDEHELTLIAFRLDIISLLMKVDKENVLSKSFASSMQKREKDWHRDNSAEIEKCLEVLTYVPLDNALYMHCVGNKDDVVKVIVDDQDDNGVV